MKDEWIRAAMSDDVVVAELLLRLKQSHASPPLLTPFKWGLRLPRSKPSSRCDVVSVRKDREPTRCSPTTPLSWSGGASPSAAADADADAFEDCSRSSSIRLAAARSKVCFVVSFFVFISSRRRWCQISDDLICCVAVCFIFDRNTPSSLT